MTFANFPKGVNMCRNVSYNKPINGKLWTEIIYSIPLFQLVNYNVQYPIIKRGVNIMRNIQTMIAKNDLGRIYDTVLSIPGMNENVKLNLQTSRKNLLLLNKLIERGLNAKETDEKSVSILDIVSGETLKELAELSAELLNKAGLSELNEKLKTF
jgi:hypothetical protein